MSGPLRLIDMAPVYSKSFFYDTVSPGTPVSFMTGPSSEVWIIRSMLFTCANSGFGWDVDITDISGNRIYSTGPQSVTTLVAQQLRTVLMPATSYSVSAGTQPVFCAIDGYVLSS